MQYVAGIAIFGTLIRVELVRRLGFLLQNRPELVSSFSSLPACLEQDHAMFGLSAPDRPLAGRGSPLYCIPAVLLYIASPLALSVIWSLLEAAVALGCARMGRELWREQRPHRKVGPQYSTTQAFAVLFLNPVSIAAHLSGSTALLPVALVVLSGLIASRQHPVAAAALLGIAAHAQPQLVALAACVPQLARPQHVQARSPLASAASAVVVTGAVAAAAAAAAAAAVPDIPFVVHGVFARLLQTELAPGIGLAWYAQQTTLDAMRPATTVLLALHPMLYPVALSQRLPDAPATAAMLGGLLVLFFDPYPAVLALPLFLGPIVLSRGAHSRFGVVTGASAVVAAMAILIPVTMTLWLGDRGGNPNFVFFQLLALSFAVAVVGQDAVVAAISADRTRRALAGADPGAACAARSATSAESIAEGAPPASDKPQST